MAAACFSSNDGAAEAVFAPTEVGTPEGDKVIKDIGPAGGTLASPDGRLTLTVPQGSLTETIAFSMQPITNKAEGGLGLAYRLEPDGKTFTTPLEITVRYNESDLESTAPEALALAYQDSEGGWHLQKEATLDQNAKILTVRTTHFSDWSFLARMRISPEKATVRVGETVQLKFVRCHYLQKGMFDRLRRWLQGSGQPCEVTNGKYYWHIRANWFTDIGTIDKPHELSVIYTAPSKKPSPNTATVSFPYELTSYGDVYAPPNRGMFTSKITIIDQGYRATGKTADVTYSGAVCSLDEPFTITGASPFNSFPFEFAPTSATGGKASFGAVAPSIRMEGSGTYKIEGADTEKPRIALTMSSMGHTPKGSRSGGGTIYIDLVPLETDDCN